jgi:polar amino acid transport system substrate-binding protein
MKKIIRFTAVLCILAAALTAAGCKKENKAGDSSLNDVKKKGIFVLGLDDSFPPMGFRDADNKIVGYDIDLASEVCKRLGVELKLQPIDWSAKEQELNTGKIDCIWNGFTMTAEREAALAFTKPYLDNAQVMIVRTDSGITSLTDLAGKKVGLQAGSSAAEALNSRADFKKTLKEVVEVKDNLMAFMDLEVKGVDGVVMDMVVGNYSIKTTSKPFTVLSEPLSSEKYGVGFRKNDIALRDAVQSALEQMASDGTVAAISTKWFGKDISVIGK